LSIRRRTAYGGDDNFVFCSPTKGTPIDPVRYAQTLRLALARAKITGYVRPFQDWRHTSLTNGAAAGVIRAALQKPAGHSSYKTTQGYIHLAGVEFPEETKKRTRRLGRERYKEAVQSRSGVSRSDGETRRIRLNGAAQESNLPSVGLRRRTGFEDQLGHRPPPLQGQGNQVTRTFRGRRTEERALSDRHCRFG